MGEFSTYAISKSGVTRICRHFAARVFAWLLAMLLMGTIGFAAGESPEYPPSKLIQDKLGGVPIATASRELLTDAVKQAVTGNQEQAASILVSALSIERKDRGILVGPLVSGAISGLGPEASRDAVTALVRTAVELQPKAVLRIVAAAVNAAPRGYANDIAAAAVAALRNPSDRLVARIYNVAAKTRQGNGAGKLEPIGEELDQIGPLMEIPPLPPNLVVTPTATPRPTPAIPPSPSL